MTTFLLEKALEFATARHAGQTRFGSADPYIVHPIRVSERVATDHQKICALLHDVVEDTPTTLDEIEKEFGIMVRDTIDCLTHRKGESYNDYITRILTDENAVRVKIADICDNLNGTPTQNAIDKSLRGLVRLITPRPL